MTVTDAFKTFQKVVNADIGDVREARLRRDLFKSAFGAEGDVDEVIASGSLARGTHKDPIHDVDVIIIFDAASHQGWGAPGLSAEGALDYTRGRVNALLGVTSGSYDRAVRLAQWRNHAVKCFLDDPDDPSAFTVDAMPALRRDGMLLIPEATSKRWVHSHPEFLIEAVAEKHAAWDKFAGTVRMLKWWASEQDVDIKSLVMEVLALEHLPLAGPRHVAVKQFFVSAAYYVNGGSDVVDPAGVCGPIQTDLDSAKFGDRLAAARDAAVQAIQAQLDNDVTGAIRWWGEVFGDRFPPPPGGGSAPAVVPPIGPRPVKDTPQG